jgi:hypothetical protein
MNTAQTIRHQIADVKRSVARITVGNRPMNISPSTEQVITRIVRSVIAGLLIADAPTLAFAIVGCERPAGEVALGVRLE